MYRRVKWIDFWRQEKQEMREEREKYFCFMFNSWHITTISCHILCNDYMKIFFLPINTLIISKNIIRKEVFGFRFKYIQISVEKWFLIFVLHSFQNRFLLSNSYLFNIPVIQPKSFLLGFEYYFYWNFSFYLRNVCIVGF